MTDLHPGQWTPEQARQWFQAQPLALGANFIPANAINQLAMWQADSFDPARIELELGWAQGLGMNLMRVFLHDLAWEADPEGFKHRVDQYLSIAQRLGIRTMLVLFDSCWDPQPQAGPQRPPRPGVHNSGWVQSPGSAKLLDTGSHEKLRTYVVDMVSRFAQDPRVQYWDVWNEPDNPGGGMGAYEQLEAQEKIRLVAALLPEVFAWVRSCKPQQPLISGLWGLARDWSPGSPELNAVMTAQLALSDLISFHDYGWPESFEQRIAQLSAYGRPLICTEYLARGNGNSFDALLPLAKQHRVGMLNWGFVDGDSQTRFPWDSWKRPYIDHEPAVWFHDVLHRDGSPYRQREVELLQAFARVG